jgi:exonuclease VII small subunit
MSENKTSPNDSVGRAGKYFKYAIGEILLVVIGIMIALQINNWNEGKKAKEKEREALIEIVSDLEYSLIDLDDVINTHNYNLTKNINSLKTLIKVLQTNQKYHDSLGTHFYSTNVYDEPYFKTSGYNSLSSIGMDLVEDSKIRSSIGQFYSATVIDTEGAFSELKQDFHEYMLDFIRKDFTFSTLKNGQKVLHPNNYESLKVNKEYIQSLRTFLNVSEYYHDNLNNITDEAIQLKKDIEDYLND